MTAAPIHWPGDGVLSTDKHMLAAVADNALGRDPGRLRPSIREFHKDGASSQRAGGKATRLLGKHQAGNGWLEGGRS